MRPPRAAELEEHAEYVFCTPEECVDQLERYLCDVPISHLYILGGLPGLDFDVARGWIEIFAREVAPPLRARLEAGVVR